MKKGLNKKIRDLVEGDVFKFSVNGGFYVFGSYSPVFGGTVYYNKVGEGDGVGFREIRGVEDMEVVIEVDVDYVEGVL
mgnify:FL=1|nr:hypothetical protein [uncultured Flavobacterium sp.]